MRVFSPWRHDIVTVSVIAAAVEATARKATVVGRRTMAPTYAVSPAPTVGPFFTRRQASVDAETPAAETSAATAQQSERPKDERPHVSHGKQKSAFVE